ncbi:MAG: polyphosphate polymerase domain-containing protein [Clostridiales bacterium]|jgi:hypothetical protein|nr:polyphosphate polymerase domain-containing protein [Clostridiales bacterium]
MEGIFRRIEKKYAVPTSRYPELLERLKEHFFEDEYGIQPIHNIYFDTQNDGIIRRSLEKPVFKEKMRLRSYGIADENTVVYAELKKKYDGTVYKRRIKLKYSEAKKYLTANGEAASGADGQIKREIDYFAAHNAVMPKIFIAYDRIALKEKNNGAARITFDFNIRYRFDKLTLGAPHPNLRFDNGDFYIMEIKSPLALPLWLTALLSEQRLFPVSFSKYGKIFEKVHGVLPSFTSAPLQLLIPDKEVLYAGEYN